MRPRIYRSSPKREAYQRSGQTVKPAEETPNRLIKEIDERRTGVSGNQDIPIPQKLIDFEATLYIFITFDSHVMSPIN